MITFIKHNIYYKYNILGDSMKKRKVKRTISLVIVLFILLLVVNILTDSTSKKLKKLKYQDKTISVIKDLKIQDVVIKNNKYSKTLEEAILNNQFYQENIDFYYEFEYRNDDKFINHLNSLIKLGYNKMQITEIFDSMSSDDIEVLLKYNYISNISDYLKYSYFNINYLDRYIEYEKSTSYDKEKLITYVNIGLDKDFYSDYKIVDNPSSNLVLVNKYNLLPSDYVPSDLVTLSNSYSLVNVKMTSEAASNFEQLSSDASVVGLSILGMSGYRSYDYQKNLYERYKENDPDKVDTYSARPGASEHQTGLALDVETKTTIYTDFGKTNEYKWLKQNAHKYGFIIRYTHENTHITGYKQEEWHIRYVGVDVATYIYENNITFDEYYVRFIENSN